MSLQLDEHREYLSDTPRIDAFRRAIHATVQPGDVVVDLACGTGILGLMACDAGAARVYAIDDSGMIQIARAVARQNGLAGRITHIAEHSSRAILPEKADVLVFDQIGHLGFEAGLLEMAADARRRLLKPSARIVPGPVRLEVALASSPIMRARVDFWRTRPAGIDASPAFATAANTGYPTSPELVELRSGSAAPIVFNPSTWNGEQLAASFELVAPAGGEVDGCCGWFRAELAPSISMTNAPGDPNRISRRAAFLPFERPLALDAGEAVRLTLRILPADSIVSWEVSRQDGSDRMAHSIWKGMLPTREGIARTRAGATPVLTDRGLARKTVLDLCDGRRTVRDVETALVARHPDLFADREAAEVFVAEVVAVYART